MDPERELLHIAQLAFRFRDTVDQFQRLPTLGPCIIMNWPACVETSPSTDRPYPERPPTEAASFVYCRFSLLAWLASPAGIDNGASSFVVRTVLCRTT